MKIGIYDRWLATLGGGERMALTLAETLALEHTVDVIAHQAVDLDAAAAKFNLDLQRVQLRCVPELPDDDDYAPLTADYDLFIAASQATFIPSRAKHSWLLAFFPYPIELSIPARVRRSAAQVLRRELRLPLYARGFYGAEPEGATMLRWTDGHGVLCFPRRSGALIVRLSIRALADTDVYVNDRLYARVKATSAQTFTPLSVKVEAHAEAAQIDLITAPHAQPIGLRADRAVGAAVRAVEVIHWRYRLYQQLFERRNQHWGLRLLNIPAEHGAAALQTYSTVIGISRFTQTWIRRYWRRDSELLYPPVAIESFQPDAKRNVILTVGRIFAGAHNKQHMPMIDTFRRLLADDLHDWEFHIVGSVDGGAAHQAYFQQLQAAAHGLPIFLHPNASLAELQTLYGAAKIYWHASGYGEDVQRDPIKFEHFGITTVEAMAAGAVPIVIGQGGQFEIVEHNRSGLVWQTQEELAAQTRQVIDDPTLWLRLSTGALERSRAFGRAAFDRRVRQLVDQTTSRSA